MMAGMILGEIWGWTKDGDRRIRWFTLNVSVPFVMQARLCAEREEDGRPVGTRNCP